MNNDSTNNDPNNNNSPQRPIWHLEAYHSAHPGKLYYFNRVFKATQWQKPHGVEIKFFDFFKWTGPIPVAVVAAAVDDVTVN